jgi:hypothetical protein
MGINVRTKGQQGEREVADMLNLIIYQSMKKLGYPEQEALRGMTTVQRNQMQSAVGGNDLTNCLGLSIEVKRQEVLAVPTWWRQTCAAAERNNEVPVLMYRQNRKAWKIRTKVWVNLPHGGQIEVIADMDLDGFKAWFANWAEVSIASGAEVKV